MNNQDINSMLIKSIFLFLCFVFCVFLVIAAVYMYNTNGEFLSAIKLSYRFYLSAGAVFVASALVYTPLSYGITNYFLRSDTCGFTAVFYLFRKPGLLVKAILLSLTLRVITLALRLAVLVASFAVQCLVFVLCVLLSGENIFDFERTFFQSAADFFVTNKFLVLFSVIQWSAVLLYMFYTKIKYIFCKYVMILNPVVGVTEAVHIGTRVIKNKILVTAKFYLVFISACILVFVSFGKYRLPKSRSFSLFAKKTVLSGMQTYFGNC